MNLISDDVPELQVVSKPMHPQMKTSAPSLCITLAYHPLKQLIEEGTITTWPIERDPRDGCRLPVINLPLAFITPNHGSFNHKFTPFGNRRDWFLSLA